MVMDLRGILFEGAQIIIGISGVLIITGIVFIKLGKKDIHKKSMLTATFFALIFVVLYVIRSAIFPHTKYVGDYRTLFLAILWSHSLLALVNGPMAAITIYFAFKERFERHKKIAPYTAAVWIYVAATGWVIFALLK